MIKVFIIDDSALMRTMLSEVLQGVAGIEVIGSAQDPIFAQTKMASCWPDVIVLDLEMPRMDGLTFLKKLMHERPTPVVVCSACTANGSDAAIESLRLGAVEVIEKPSVGIKEFLSSGKNDFIQSIRAAASARFNSRQRPNEKPKREQKIASSSRSKKERRAPVKYIGIGSSTGGTQALEEILLGLSKTCPPILIVQHMPELFTKAFADRLNQKSRICIREAANGDRLEKGVALIAPGGKHMRVQKQNDYMSVVIADGPPVNRHRPSVDVLFSSMLKVQPGCSAAFILTGMGNDGARGLKALHEAGALTAAQDEASCVVFGMPKEAIRLQAADYVLPLNRIAPFIEYYAVTASSVA